MRILVTGGAGFIGSHVVDAYVEAGHTVAVIDNLSSGVRENLPMEVPIYEGDVQDLSFMRHILDEFRPDVINHHAAQISVTASVRDSFADAEANVLGVNSLLMAMIEHTPKAKLIYASSGGAMYAADEKLPYTETSRAEASSPYGLSKYVAEQYVWLYQRMHGITATVLRYSNVFGPRQTAHGEAGVCAIFADRMTSGQSVTVYGDGSATRDFVFVKDVASANLAALTKGGGTSVNISTGKATSVTRVFELFKAALDYDLEPNFHPMRRGELLHSLLSPDRAADVLDWTSATSFEDGVAETASWYKHKES